MAKSVNQSWKPHTQWLPCGVWTWRPQHKTKRKAQGSKPCVPAFPRHCPYHMQWNYPLISSLLHYTVLAANWLICLVSQCVPMACSIWHRVWSIGEYLNGWINGQISEYMNECLKDISGSCQTLIKNHFILKFPLFSLSFLCQGHLIRIQPPSQILPLLLREQKHSSAVGKCVQAPRLTPVMEIGPCGHDLLT